MATIGGIIIFILATLMLIMGIRSLRDSSNHGGYGVDSVSLHKKFSWLFIVLGSILTCIAGILVGG